MDGFRPLVVAPTYNNAGTLRDVIDRVTATEVPLLVVNDGSTDGTADVLARWRREAAGEADDVVTHERNRGKAHALMTGFTAAAARGFTHAVTMDTDGQLDPEQIPELLEVAAKSPRALVIGARDDTRPDYPARSRLGRRWSNLAIRLECGATVEDSQCGFRVYPLRLFDDVRCDAGRFGFEAEIITRAAWAGYGIVNVPVRCRYFDAGQRVSHFRPGRDSLHGLLLHARLLLAGVFRRLK